jgi:hypothetical protein
MRVALQVSAMAGLLALAAPTLAATPSTNPYPMPKAAQPSTVNSAPAVIHVVVCEMTVVEGTANAATTPSVCIR